MSVPTNLHNGVFEPQIPIDQSIYEQSTTQKARLGTRLAVGDRVFRYARLTTSANVLAGDLLCMPAVVASHQTAILTISAQTAGQYTLTCSASAGNEFTANQYAEGYVTVASTGLAGGGGMFRIKSHGSGAAVAFTIYDALPEAVAAGPGSLTRNMYNGVGIGGAVTAVPSCVAPCDVTTGNYFWGQTWGIAPIKASTAIGAGIGLCLGVSGGVAGILTIGAITGGGHQFGKAIGVTVESHANPVWLTIMP